jgi:hypothetical protein
MKITKIIFSLIVLFFIFSCGNEPPIISFVNYNVLIYQKGGLINTDDSIYLSVYFVLDDDNGIDDIAKIKIIHTQSEYSWVLSKNVVNNPVNWRDKNYIGYPFLKYGDGKSILTGEYIIEVEDYGGNIVRSSFFVEIPNILPNEEYKLEDINYKLEIVNNNKELKISGDDFSSCEIKFLDDPNIFNGGRKKITDTKKIVLNNGEALPNNTRISLRINKNEEGTIVYFLKTITIE